MSLKSTLLEQKVESKVLEKANIFRENIHSQCEISYVLPDQWQTIASSVVKFYRIVDTHVHLLKFPINSLSHFQPLP